MGRGKKKDKTPITEAGGGGDASTSAQEPATEEPQTQPVEESEGLGLTGGGGKKRPKKKKADAQAKQGGEAGTALPVQQITKQLQKTTLPSTPAQFPQMGGQLPQQPEPQKHALSALSPPYTPGPPGFQQTPSPLQQQQIPSQIHQQPRESPSQPYPPPYQQPYPSPPYQQPYPTQPTQQPRAPPGQQKAQPTPWAAVPHITQPLPPTQFPPQRVEQLKPPMEEPVMTYQQKQQKSLAECKYVIPLKKPGNTVRCSTLKVMANYMPLSITPMIVYRYDAVFNPVNPKKFYWDAMLKFMDKHFPKNLTAFDGVKNVFSTKKLKGVGEERFADHVVIKDTADREVKFEVSLKETGAIDLNQLNVYMRSGTSLNPPAEAVQCLDVVLRQGTLRRDFVKAGRSFFMRPSKPLDLGEGLEMWTGLFQSAIFASRPYLNIDVAHKGIPKAQSMLDLAKEFGFDTRDALDSNKNNRWTLETFNEFIKNLKVMASVSGKKTQKREFMVNSLSQPANKQTFVFKEESGKETKMTVAEYFLQKKNHKLEMPYMNCLWVGPRDKAIHFPLELCDVSYGQPRNKQLNERQLPKMVREAATRPDVRYSKIQEMIRKVNYRDNPFYKEFGIKVSDEFISVNARQLMPPTIQYAGNQTATPVNGQWRMTKFYTSKDLDKWGIIGVECDMRACNTESLINLFENEGRKMGLKIAKPMLTKYSVNVHDLHRVMQDALRESLQLLVVIITSRRKDAYGQVKKVAERQVGILTQCVKQQTMFKFNPSTASNILLKVNSKLSGLNQVLAKTIKPKCLTGFVMVVGADVTHPSPDQQNIPSIAAVTASIDQNCYQYNVCLSIQSPKKEMIQQFEEMMVDHLKVFKSKANNNLPTKLYIYRDGVSDGQFAQVLQFELSAVYEAFKRMGATKMPEVLFLLVQKRHHTRFFMGPKDEKNVPPGTVVDKDIVHSRELDFYLVSHAAIKGTARPTRYHCICNEPSLADDEVQQLTFYLCHLYSRCTRSVSYPAPTYYAHLACLRARALTQGEQFINTDLDRKPQRLYVLDAMLKTNPMFYI